MPGRFTNPHLNISARRIRRDYKAHSRDMSGGGTPRNRVTHGERLAAEFAAAIKRFEDNRPTDGRLPDPGGIFLEVELVKGTPVDTLERKRDSIATGATRLEANDNRSVAVFVPDGAREVLDRILEDYAHGELTGRGNPQRQSQVEPIEAIREATFRTYWTDRDDRLPDDSSESIWWEVWCVPSGEDDLEGFVDALDLRIAEREQRIYFPEAVVIPVYGPRTAIELILFAKFTITELRRAGDTPSFYLDQDPNEQIEWTENLAERTIWPGQEAPAVCLLDTGVNRAHSLIEPALSADDLLTVDAEWQGFDTGEGHGTGMAGLCLHGDLTHQLAGTGDLYLNHRLESVKFLPPIGAQPNNPNLYGAITQSAIALSEINKPERQRVFCMAVSNALSGAVPSSWSAAMDQACAGVMIGDEARIRRLAVVATGNAPCPIDAAQLAPIGTHAIEDPAQSWNVLTIGGFTDKTEIQDVGYDTFNHVQTAGDLSLHTRTSEGWETRSPIKPDLVLEAGNHALSPAGTDLLELDSLGVLTTGDNVDVHPLVPFRATSAATAQAARLAAKLMADHPEFWPETIRALMIHSAEWTPPMRAELGRAEGLTDAAALLRRFGYGVPNYDRATASALNSLALFAQSEMQPFKTTGGRGFKDCHFYPLPWPREKLEQLGGQDVRVKITLSYFIEPNPGVSAAMEPYRYQSFGLRFDLRRRNESMAAFVARVSAAETQVAGANTSSDGNWRFGPNSVSAGSLHSDVWTGPAVNLLTQNTICIKPVGGWWRNRADVDTCNRKTRYALVVTLQSEDAEIDLYTPISTMIENRTSIETPF